MMGSVNYMTTIINMRAPGMTLFRMPMTVWSMFITAILQAFALPVLTVALILQTLDKTLGTVFFLPPDGLLFGNWATGAGGGQPLLWQHLFWFLFASGGVHYDSTRDGYGLGYYHHQCPPSTVWV